MVEAKQIFVKKKHGNLYFNTLFKSSTPYTSTEPQRSIFKSKMVSRSPQSELIGNVVREMWNLYFFWVHQLFSETSLKFKTMVWYIIEKLRIMVTSRIYHSLFGRNHIRYKVITIPETLSYGVIKWLHLDMMNKKNLICRDYTTKPSKVIYNLNGVYQEKLCQKHNIHPWYHGKSVSQHKLKCCPLIQTGWTTEAQ